jgi:transcriptional regulator with XRE-family HTH domain
MTSSKANKTIDVSIYHQSEIARRLGVDKSYVSRVLRGERKGPKALKLLNQIQYLIKSHKAA